MRICVIGASGGIGRALCTEYSRRGHDVWTASRSSQNDAVTVHRSVIDIRDRNSLITLRKEMHASDWHPDIIVIAAAVQLNDMENGYDHALGQDVLRTNLEGPLACVEVFLPSFLERGRGSFVALCSTAALRPSTRSTSYAASKAGLEMAWRSLRLRYDQQGIRFALAYLGPIDIGMWEGKKSMLVPTATAAATAIAAFACSRKQTLFYPRISTLLLRLSLPLSDKLASSLARRFFPR